MFVDTVRVNTDSLSSAGRGFFINTTMAKEISQRPIKTDAFKACTLLDLHHPLGPREDTKAIGWVHGRIANTYIIVAIHLMSGYNSRRSSPPLPRAQREW